MTETAGMGPGPWLPPRAAQAMAREEAREAAEARRAQAELEARREEKHEAALGAWRQAAELRGEAVSALAIARGEGGRTVQDVFSEAVAAADREDARAAVREGRENAVWIGSGEPVIHASRGDGWPESSRELDRQLRRADELHRDLIAFQARRNYPAAEEATRAKSTRATSAMTSRTGPGDWLPCPGCGVPADRCACDGARRSQPRPHDYAQRVCETGFVIR